MVKYTIRGVAVYLGDLKSRQFGDFVMVARELADIPFAHIDSQSYDEQDIYMLGKESFREENQLFTIFVYRRGNFQEMKEYRPELYPTLP